MSLFILHETEVLIDGWRHASDELESAAADWFAQQVLSKKFVEELVSIFARRWVLKIGEDIERRRAVQRLGYWPQLPRPRGHQVLGRRVVIAPRARSNC